MRTWRRFPGLTGLAVTFALVADGVAAADEDLVVKAEATAVGTIAVSWTERPLAESYRVRLFRLEGLVGTAVSDYSGLPDIWPEGWIRDDDWDSVRGFWTNSGKPFPKFTYSGQWLATCVYPAAVTKVSYSVRSGSSSAGVLMNQYLLVEIARDADGDWEPCRNLPVAAETVTNDELAFAASNNVRRIRFVAETLKGAYQPNVNFGKVTVAYGEYARVEAASAAVAADARSATFDGLDRTARYVAVVTPLPGEEAEQGVSSPIVDLSTEYFRTVGPVSLADCKGVYTQDFVCLASVEKETDAARVPIDAWQLFKGSDAAEKLLYTAGTNSTKSGVYCYSDTSRSTNSFMLGTVASGNSGSSVGLAFVNDTESSLAAPTVTFTSVQRNFKANPATYALEWMVTDGPWSIGTESASWQGLQIPATAPFTTETCGGRTEYRQEAIVVTPVFSEEVVPGRKLRPGQVLILRWRHAMQTSGPMMGLDDVRVEFPVPKDGFGVIIR